MEACPPAGLGERQAERAELAHALQPRRHGFRGEVGLLYVWRQGCLELAAALQSAGDAVRTMAESLHADRQ